jgi:hypothetical protein
VPTTQEDRRTLAKDMDVLLDGLRRARHAEFKEVGPTLAELFGERVSTRTVEAFLQRRDQRFEPKSLQYERGTGAVIASRRPRCPPSRVRGSATQFPLRGQA